MATIRRLAIRAGIATSCASWMLLSVSAWAGNGFNLAGTGAKSLSMGGADVAYTDDTNALALNPAGLSQIKDSRFDLTFYPYIGRYAHSDELGNDAHVDDGIGLINTAGYATRLESRPDIVVGTLLNVQGGTGFRYNNAITPFGNRDDLLSILGVFRLAFGGAWQVNEQWSIGATAGVSYGAARQKFFPKTSTPEFQGFRFDGGKTVQFNGAFGLLYSPTPELRLALAYTSKIKLPLKDATLTVDYSALDQGRVRYNDARIDGLSLPQEVSAGFVWQTAPRWQLVGDVKWIDWSQVRSNRLSASDPENANVAAVYTLTTPLNFKDQYVFALATTYQYDTLTTLRAGSQVTQSAVPKQSSSPLLNLGQRYEVDFGIGRQLNEHWVVDGALQLVPPQKTRYTSPLFGESTETFEAYSVIVTFSRSW